MFVDIKGYVAKQKQKLKEEVALLTVKPKFVVIQVNDDPASNAYVRGKLKDADEIGILSQLVKLPEDTSEEELLKIIDQYNHDETVHGLIVQMPLPKQINEEHIKLAINYKKDIDGFHPMSPVNACTPQGIMNYLERCLEIRFQSKNAVVIGRSNIVGRPMAKLLLDASCNVTVLHSKTSKRDFYNYISNADIIVSAVGNPGILKKDFEYQIGCIIVDVGITRGEDGKLHGDAEPGIEGVFQTPVPGGVGLLTRLTLMENILCLYKESLDDR